MRLRSFKLRFADEHVRIVPATDAAGCPFSGPGVDLRGEPAARAFELAAPLIAALAEAEPGVAVRSLAIDLERPRITATLEPAPASASADPRPRVVRIDGGALLRRLLDRSPALCDHLGREAAAALARRAARTAGET
jgi:hypothetical protein